MLTMPSSSISRMPTFAHALIFSKGPKGPESALGFFEKVPSPTSTSREATASKTTEALPQRARGSRDVLFVLRYYYYVNVNVFVYVMPPPPKMRRRRAPLQSTPP